MAYQCQNFKDGQVLTAECLNKMDKAIEEACKSSGVTDEHINALIDAKLAELPAVPTYTGEVEVE